MNKNRLVAKAPGSWLPKTPAGFILSSIVIDPPAVITSFMAVSPRDFKQRIEEVRRESDFYRANLDPKPSYKNYHCWLRDDRRAGFSVSPDYELTNVFSLDKRKGDDIMRFATKSYEYLHLNCFSVGYLESFYKSHGFTEIRREPYRMNEHDLLLTNQGVIFPDILYMARDARSQNMIEQAKDILSGQILIPKGV